MTNLNRREAGSAVIKSASMLLIGLAAVLMAGCGSERDADDGQLFNSILLPTDTLLNLACENVGIFDETCVLNDPENPYSSTVILEFNPQNPGVENKFDLVDMIPAGPTGAKARFYLWATALARFPSGENQWYTGRALHELYTYNQDELIRLQALKAYRSNLENFFGSVSFFTEFGVTFPGGLNEIVACDIFRPPADFTEVCLNEDTGAACNDLEKLGLFGEWGFQFKLGPNPSDPCAGSLVEVIGFP